MDRHVHSRRVFLQRGLALLAASVTVPMFIDQTVMALTRAGDVPATQLGSGKDGKILIVVQLSGGNDGLSMVVPYADDIYHRARGDLAHGPKTVLRLNDYIGLHPNLTGLKDLYDDGMLSVVQGVGYPNPNRSHFKSMDIWHTARPDDESAADGWLGRYFDNTCDGSDPHAGVSIGETLPLSMQGERVMPISFESPGSYRYNGRDRDRYEILNGITPTKVDADVFKTRVWRDESETGKIATADEQLDFLHRTALDAQVSSDRIIRLTQKYTPGVNYPSGAFGSGLKTVAAMIAGGLSTRVYYVNLGGFDTHAGQRNRHDRLMKELSDGLAALWADLRHQKNAERVMVMTFSEFGRRVQANASGGTDHGAAAPMLLMGANLKDGIIGKHPSLRDLDQGDLKHGIDFRNVYGGLLQQWLDTPARAILGASVKPVKLVTGI